MSYTLSLPDSRVEAMMPKVLARIISVSTVLVTIAAASLPIHAQSPKHPLDGLTASEIWTAYDVLQAAHKPDDDTRYPMVQLKEPPKEEVLAWKPGQDMRREAFVVVKQGSQTFEAVVDVNAKKMVSWTEIKGVQPNTPDDEQAELGDVVKGMPEVQEALKKRGITNLGTVGCAIYPEGYFGSTEHPGHRVFRVLCAQAYGALADWAPIEGLTIVWDGTDKKVLRVIDTGAVPVPHTETNYYKATLGAPRDLPPIAVEQKMGPAYRLDGQSVSWQKWNFHFRVDRRVGLIVTNVGYEDGGKLRSILYEGSLSEIFVPYMDPSEGWMARTFFDPGMVGSGFSSSLNQGQDCPEQAVYFDQAYADWKGMPHLKPRAACLFEQPSGSPAWRHDDGSVVESRAQRELVLRTIGVFGNYDYVVDWIFQQNGAIRVRVGATGQVNIMPVKARSAAEDAGGQDSRYGRFIADYAVGVDHDHFFSFRLDFDLDGAANSFVRDKFQTVRLPEGSARKSLWVAEPETAKTEDQGKVRMSMEKPENWRIVNPNVKSPQGYPVGYEVMGGQNAMSLMLPEDYPQKRAGFTDYQVWVTPYRADERYAAGDYPFESEGGEGLPAWTKSNRSIENTDIVLWYTVGFHHVPHAEDWPVMPTVWHEFELTPVNFFAHNPALDLP
jgi:primary-amine oxidase